MYVIATCGAFVVGVECNVCPVSATMHDIERNFADSCLSLFSTREEKVENVRVYSVSDNDPIVTALLFMDKYTDESYKAIRKHLTDSLKGSILSVYTKVYEKEMQRKVEALRNHVLG